jgi:hypothetical protein
LFSQEKGEPFGCSLSLGKKSLALDLGLFEGEVVHYVVNKPEETVLTFRSELAHAEYLRGKELMKRVRDEATQRDEAIRVTTIEKIKK